MTLEKLIFENNCIKSKACMEIYRKSCLKVQQCFEGLISYPAMIILSIFFNIDSWSSDSLSRLSESRKIKSISNLFLATLAKDWGENCDLEQARVRIDEVITQFALMNEIFPCPRMETRLELNRLIYADTRQMCYTWFNEQCQEIAILNSQIRHGNIDGFIANAKKNRHAGNPAMLSVFWNGIGKVFQERSNRILRHQVGLSMRTMDDDLHSVRTIFNTLNILKVFAVFTMEEQVKTMCGKSHLHIQQS